jgi:hypothetical protein
MRKFLLLAATLLAGPTFADDIAGTTFTLGTWQGGAAIGPDGGFSHCYATLRFTNGDQIWVNVTKAEQIEVIFSFQRLKLTKDQTMEATLMMEVGTPTRGTALALDERIVSFGMTPLNDAHAYLSQGHLIRLLGVGNDEAYDVRGMGGALGLVRSCAEKQRG